MSSRRFIRIDGKEVEITDPTKLTKKQKEWCKEHGIKLPGIQGVRIQSTWPMCSDALGVNPIQREAAMEHADRIGIPTEFNELGQAVFTDAAHRRRYCEETKYFDKNGGYSDPQKHTRDLHPDA